MTTRTAYECSLKSNTLKDRLEMFHAFRDGLEERARIELDVMVNQFKRLRGMSEEGALELSVLVVLQADIKMRR